MSNKLSEWEIPQNSSHTERRTTNRRSIEPSLSVAATTCASQVLMRHDIAGERAVDIGIGLQEILGTRDAALFLKNNVIDLDVALRVLLCPDRRRSVHIYSD